MEGVTLSPMSHLGSRKHPPA